ncbi:MAG TPA: protein kinase [Pirellulales bacterium]|jgi:serine/threonine protein kinase
MSQPKNTCDLRRIEQCLGDALSDDEQAAFEAHLEVCPRCREALETSAAQPDDWQRARDFLSSTSNLPLYPDKNESSSVDAKPTQNPLPLGEGRVRVQGIQNRHPHPNPLPVGEGAGDATELKFHSRSETPESDAVEMNLRESVDGVLTALAPTDDPRMLGRLGGYEIAGVVGRGGMGVVLKALDPSLNRYVAIKVLAPQLATSGAARQRFAREARAAASVVHENVVAIHAVADGGVLPYFVMPYLRGASLQKRIDANGPLGISEILRVGIQIASGLAAAHAQGLVHRDIKPANILLEDGVERLKITDFGLARAADDASLTRTGVIAGTPQFMSPEQARGEGVDTRSDLFSLGSVMYAMCTGRPPFRSETSYGTLQRICESQPRSIRESNPEIPEWLAAFIGKLHEKDPNQRFQTAQEIAQLLEQCLAHLRQPDAVPMPQSVVELAALKENAHDVRRAVWLSRNTLRLRRAASFSVSTRQRAAATLVAAIALILVLGYETYNGFDNRQANNPNPAATSSQSQSSVASAPAADVGPAPSSTVAAIPVPVAPQPIEADPDYGLMMSIGALKADIANLENRISVLEQAEQPAWDHRPTSDNQSTSEREDQEQNQQEQPKP